MSTQNNTTKPVPYPIDIDGCVNVSGDNGYDCEADPAYVEYVNTIYAEATEDLNNAY